MVIFFLLLAALAAGLLTARLVARRDYSRSVQGFSLALRRLDHVRITAGSGQTPRPRLGAPPSGNVRVVPARGARSRSKHSDRPLRARAVRR
jgi:hypothetical protein